MIRKLLAGSGGMVVSFVIVLSGLAIEYANEPGTLEMGFLQALILGSSIYVTATFMTSISLVAICHFLSPIDTWSARLHLLAGAVTSCSLFFATNIPNLERIFDRLPWGLTMVASSAFAVFVIITSLVFSRRLEKPSY